MATVTQDWLESLSFKQQTVLLTALRGCDGISKEDCTKKLVRDLRRVILKDAAPTAGQFMSVCKLTDVLPLVDNMDMYPMHWLMHYIHAVEIVGYNHPDFGIKNKYHNMYLSLVDGLHLQPETKEQNDTRLKDLL